MKVYSVRLEDAQVKALEALGLQRGVTASEVLRDFIDRGLSQDPPAPAPAPRPAPAEPGQAGAARGLPDALQSRLETLRQDLTRLRLYGLLLALEYWGPKALALLAAERLAEPGDAQTFTPALGAVMVFIIIDAFWTGRVLRREVLSRGRREMEELTQALPKLWEEASKRLSPAAAEAQVLSTIGDRRRRLGELAVRDIELAFWNP